MTRFLFFMIVYLVAFGSKGAVNEHEEKPMALMNGIAHLGNEETIENAVITFKDGKITLVADARLVRLDLTGYEVIDIAGKHIYPIKTCSKNGNKKFMKVICKNKSNLLDEHQPANLVVLADELAQSENAILMIFSAGQRQPDNAYKLSNKKLIQG